MSVNCAGTPRSAAAVAFADIPVLFSAASAPPNAVRAWSIFVWYSPKVSASSAPLVRKPFSFCSIWSSRLMAATAGSILPSRSSSAWPSSRCAPAAFFAASAWRSSVAMRAWARLLMDA
ncbi:hypothetical protein D3C72_1208260 [compost metagenome]